jgi:hypothetical protein
MCRKASVSRMAVRRSLTLHSKESVHASAAPTRSVVVLLLLLGLTCIAIALAAFSLSPST